MFAVMFEVHPKSDQRDAYLDYAKMLRPELEQIDGFVDNVRYESRSRGGWILSLSSWRDEKSLVRWRTQATHHGVQEKGRLEVFLDYHLRVGQVTSDSHIPNGYALREQRLDETEVGVGSAAVLVTATRKDAGEEGSSPEDLTAWLGLETDENEPSFLDVYEAVLTPGDFILQSVWRDASAAAEFANRMTAPDESRARTVRIVRDYSMYDRRETPQFYAELSR
jgi:heme-degrading monooxygenase HmoA